MTTFDPACEFLLTSTNHESLFEQAGDETEHRCKGCRQIVKRWDRLDHWHDHKIASAFAEVARKALLRVESQKALARAREARRTEKAA